MVPNKPQFEGKRFNLLYDMFFCSAEIGSPQRPQNKEVRFELKRQGPFEFTT